jgi:2-oxoglutarate ferredoxin oxidoreductase subunit alpha
MQRAFNIAERYQTTVIVMSDQHLADSFWSVDALDSGRIPVERAIMRNDAIPDDYKRHKITETGVSPRAVPGQAGRAVVVTDSDEHDEEGHLIEDAGTRKAMADKRMRKLKGISSEVTAPELYGAESPELLLIGWGSTYGAIREAVDILQVRGKSVSMLHLSQLWPFPPGVGTTVSSAEKSITIENNSTGQLRSLIRMETGIDCSGSITKYDGRPFTPEEIAREIDNVVN